MVLYPLIKEGQLSHKYAIASPVEPMNLLSKGSNELLPKYQSTIWKNGLLPSCSVQLDALYLVDSYDKETSQSCHCNLNLSKHWYF